MMISPFMMGLIDMVILGSDKSFPDKVLPMLLGIMKRGCLVLSHKELVMNPYGLFVLGKERDMSLAGLEGCFSDGESGHKMRDCPKAKAKGRENAPKRN